MLDLMETTKRGERRAALDALKMARGGCEEILPDGSRCGWNRHPAGLQWDHIEPKLHSLRQAFRSSWAMERILAEIAKCELVCACCHAIRTAERGYTGGAPMHKNAPDRDEPRRCARGHERTEANTYTWRGEQWCRICLRVNRARYRQRRREAALRSE